MNYHFKIKKEKNGLWAECVELDGCRSEAESMEELMANMKEALNLYLSEPQNSKMIFPLPKKRISLKGKVVEVKVESAVAFSMIMRMTRLKQNLTLKQMATKLQYKDISTYAKLEKASSANPELKTLAKIKEIFKDFPINLILS